MIHPNTDAGVSKDACLSLFEWAHYLLEPHAGIEKNNDSLDSDNDLKGPMISYEITDDEINWKKEIDTDTAGTNATASVTEEDKLWNQFDWNVESKNPATLRQNIAKALELSRSRYTKLKRMTKEQQEEKDTIEIECYHSCKCTTMKQAQRRQKTGKIPSLTYIRYINKNIRNRLRVR